MAEYFGSKGKLERIARGNRSVPLVLMLWLLLPAFGIFCWQWVPSSQSGSPEAPAHLQLTSPTYLRGITAWSQHAQFSDFKQVHASSDPFSTDLSREMIVAQGDPFLLAVVSGETEGRLIVKHKANGIVTLGPPVPMGRMNTAQSEIEAVQRYTGGSFAKFFASIFGNTRHGSGASDETQADAAQEREENPFLKAREALAENQAVEKTEAMPDKTPAEPATKDQAAPPVRQAMAEEKPAVPPVSPVATVRPNLLLHLADGVLHTTPASHPRANLFESSELGVQDMAVLPFTDPQEFPTSIAVADFNGDGTPDVAFDVAVQGLLRVFYGSPDGSYAEGLRIEIGRGARSMAAGDFNRDGRVDLAISSVGTGMLTFFVANSEGTYDYKATWIDEYRDYILAADTTGRGTLDVLGMNFANRAIVLREFDRPEGSGSTRNLQYMPSLQSEVSTATGKVARVNAVALGSSLSLNIDNQQNQLVNVVNIAAGCDMYLVVGDLNSDGSITVGIARPTR